MSSSGSKNECSWLDALPPFMRALVLEWPELEEEAVDDEGYPQLKAKLLQIVRDIGLLDPEGRESSKELRQLENGLIEAILKHGSDRMKSLVRHQSTERRARGIGGFKQQQRGYATFIRVARGVEDVLESGQGGVVTEEEEKHKTPEATARVVSEKDRSDALAAWISHVPEEVLDEWALRIPAARKEMLANVFSRAASRERWRRVLGLDLRGMDNYQAIECVNGWLSDNAGRFGDSPASIKDQIAATLREIRDELQGIFVAVDKKSKQVDVSIVTEPAGTPGSKRFCLRIVGERNKSITAPQALPQFRLKNLGLDY